MSKIGLVVVLGIVLSGCGPSYKQKNLDIICSETEQKIEMYYEYTWSGNRLTMKEFRDLNRLKKSFIDLKCIESKQEELK